MSTKRLDDLFGAYEKRKQAEERSAEEKAAKLQRERDMALRMLNERVVPQIHALAAEVRQRGHEANVTADLDQEHPIVILEFTPAKRTTNPPFPAQSRVKFTWNGGEYLETIQEIAHTASRGIAERHRITEITAEWTNVQAIYLIEAALKNN